jgi:tRNA threonylcarbamoyladenosine biosynthesis protein TsaB
MKVLGLDTATSTAGIAIVDGDRVLVEARHDSRGRGADLLVAIDAICRKAGVAPADLDAVAIGAGPGSFTGLRIGMATAKGIAFAANRPLWAVSSLAALAADGAQALATGEPAAAQPANGSADGPAICAVLDARRGEVFAGVFRRAVALGAERVMAPEELAPWALQLAGSSAHAPEPEPDVRFAGNAIDAYPALSPLATRWLAVRTPSGAAVARLALAGAHIDITLGGAPTYIRPSEAEVKYPEGVPGALRRR